MNSQIIIERLPFDIKWNNHNQDKDPNDPEYLEIKDVDKKIEIRKTWLNAWAKLLNYPILYTFELTPREIEIMEEASRVGRLTMHRSSLVKEELNEIENRMESEIPFPDGIEYFIRMDSASPKDGHHDHQWLKSGGITSAKDAIDVLSTSDRAHTAFINECNKIYFMAWDQSMDTARELRVFVHHGKICAISQYSCSEKSLFQSLNDMELVGLGRKVVEYTLEIINRVKSIGTTSMVADLTVNQDFSLKLIELNSFGYWMCSGGSCFNWNTDREKMYGRLGEKVFFRIVKPS